MDAADDHQTLTELLAANRELVEVNRQIAASLASLERLYAEDVGRRQQVSRRMQAQIRQMNGHPLRGWWTWGIILIPAAVVLAWPIIMKWLGP